MQPGSEEGPRRSRPAVVVAVLAVVLLGLGSVVAGVILLTRDTSPDATTTTTDAPTLDTWREQMQDGCQSWNERYEHLEDAELRTAEDALQHATEVHELAAGLAEVVGDAGLPVEQGEPAGRLVELTLEMEEATGQLATAAREKDGPAIDAATERIIELGPQLNEAAEELDVPACGGY